MVADLRAGRVDGIWGDIPQGDFAQLKSAPGIKPIAYPYYGWDYLEFNCYDKPSSMGNPVLRDYSSARRSTTRSNKQRLIDLAYNGLASPARPSSAPTCTAPGYHWQRRPARPTASTGRAGEMLTPPATRSERRARGQAGKPIVLRLYVATDSASQQRRPSRHGCAGAARPQDQPLGASSSGAMTFDMCDYPRGNGSPNFDLVVSGGSVLRPRRDAELPHDLADRQPQRALRSDPAYDKPRARAREAVKPRSASPMIWQMQQVMYQQTPWIVFDYPDNLQAMNTARSTGWSRSGTARAQPGRARGT